MEGNAGLQCSRMMVHHHEWTWMSPWPNQTAPVPDTADAMKCAINAGTIVTTKISHLSREMEKTYIKVQETLPGRPQSHQKFL